MPDDRRKVGWSADGVQALKIELAKKKNGRPENDACAAPVEPVAGFDSLDGDGTAEREVREFVVAKRALNSRIVFAAENLEDEDASRWVRIRVRDNANFVRGMRVRARFEQEGLFVLVGRCPRFRGRW
jgi:hypothetical protein